MNKHTRNTVLYSVLTISLVISYWIVRQDSSLFESAVSNQPVLEINEQASERIELDAQPTVLVSQYY